MPVQYRCLVVALLCEALLCPFYRLASPPVPGQQAVNDSSVTYMVEEDFMEKNEEETPFINFRRVASGRIFWGCA